MYGGAVNVAARIASASAPGEILVSETLRSLARTSAGVAFEGKPWYQQTGLGMGQTLSVAAEKKGYTLADRGTYLSMKKSLGMDVLVEGDRDLLNVYHVIVVNPARWPKVNAEGAKAFAEFLVAAGTQKMIGTFGVGKYGARADAERVQAKLRDEEKFKPFIVRN